MNYFSLYKLFFFLSAIFVICLKTQQRLLSFSANNKNISRLERRQLFPVYLFYFINHGNENKRIRSFICSLKIKIFVSYVFKYLNDLKLAFHKCSAKYKFYICEKEKTITSFIIIFWSLYQYHLRTTLEKCCYGRLINYYTQGIPKLYVRHVQAGTVELNKQI